MLTKYLSKSWLIDNIFYIGLCTLATFPLFPLRFQIILFAIAGFCSLVSWWKSKFLFNKKSWYSLLVLTFPILVLLFGMIYTDNEKEGWKIIERSLSFFLIPLIFFLNIEKINHKSNNKILYVFSISTLIICLVGVSLVQIKGFRTLYPPNTDPLLMFRMDFEHYTNKHPVFANFILGIAGIFFLNRLLYLYESGKIKLATIHGFIFILILFIQLTLASRTPIIAMIVATFFSIWNILKIEKKYKFLLLFILLLTCILGSILIPTIESRFKEIKDLFSEKVNSTSVRKSQLYCSLEISKKAPIFGVGTGDVVDELLVCYKANKFHDSIINKFNNHNQYFSYYNRVGIIGLCSIFIFLVIPFLSYGHSQTTIIFKSFIIFFSICFLTENIIERQIGIVSVMFIMSIFYIPDTILKTE